MYRITIVKFEPNPDYTKDWEAIRYMQQGNIPPKEIEHKAMETVLTDAEFAAIKKAVLEVM